MMMSRRVICLFVLATLFLTGPAVAQTTQSDVTSLFTLSVSGLVYNRTTNTFNSVVSITNTSATLVSAPISLSVTGLPQSVTLANRVGFMTDGSPYVSVPTTPSLGPGQKASNILLQFQNPTRVTFNATVHVWGVSTTATSFTPGPSTLVTTQTIGASGGTIVVANSGTPLDGSTITFPIGALSANARVTVSFNHGALSPAAGVFPGVALVLDVSGTPPFDQPVSITVPYNGGSNSVPVPYYVTSTGALRPLQILSIDRQGGTFTFQTFHASVFTWIWGLLFPPHNVLATAYLPANNGFQVVNTATIFTRPGECLGMTSFSLWFWLNEAALGNFYPKYYNVVGTDSNGNPLRGQNVIATRAYISIIQQWNTYLPMVSRQQTLTQAERYASIHNIIANTEAPVLIYLYHSSGTDTSAHSVLAYAIDNTANQISVYDPNLPGTVQHIQYSAANQTFQTYCNGACYDGIVYNGDGSLNLSEPYTHILADAQNTFNNSGGATITLTSHTSGQSVSSLLQTLVGTIHSGQLLITKLTAIVGSTPYSTPVGLDGSFSIPIALVSGINHIKFKSEGKDFSGTLVPPELCTALAFRAPVSLG